MIIDDNNVSIDFEELSGGSITGEAIGLTSFRKPGRQGPIFMTAFISDDAAGGSGLDLKLEQSREEDGEFSEVPGSAISVDGDYLEPGVRVGWRIVPPAVKNSWLRVVATGTGFTAGKLFAAVVTEDLFPYEKGLYIDKNVTLA